MMVMSLARGHPGFAQPSLDSLSERPYLAVRKLTPKAAIGRKQPDMTERFWLFLAVF